MAYTDDAVKAKLSALNETQEGIVTVAQWIMFHRRHADKTAQLWMSRLKDSSSSKRLNLIYLANEVVQQSKARNKLEFPAAFSPIIAEAASVAYKGASSDIQQKLRRVIEVWRARAIFEPPIQDAIEAEFDKLDKSRGTLGKKPTLGGSLFSSDTLPKELKPLLAPQIALIKLNYKPLLTTANDSYARESDPSIPKPTPPKHAGDLGRLFRALATAEGAVSEGIKARRELIQGLESILETNKEQLVQEENLAADLNVKKAEIDTKRKRVEDGILNGLPPTEENEPSRPDAEPLTPPPVESLTPVGTPPPMQTDLEASAPPEQPSNPTQLPGIPAPAPAAVPSVAQPGADLLSSLQMAPLNGAQTHGTDSNGYSGDGYDGPSVKRRRVGSGQKEDFAEFVAGNGIEGIDEDV